MGKTTSSGEGDPRGKRRRVGEWTAEELLTAADGRGVFASDLLAHAALGLVEELGKRDP
jgi:hypothetical protein